MKQYRIKHEPSGYYWAPGGKLSKIGKVFTDETKDILAKVHKDSNSTEDAVSIYMVSANSPLFKKTQGTIHWVEDRVLGGLYYAHIPKDEFVREEVGTQKSYKVRHKKSGLYYAGGYKLNGKGKIYAGKSVLDDKEDKLFVVDDSKTHTTYEVTKDVVNWEKRIDGQGSTYYAAYISKNEFEKEMI